MTGIRFTVHATCGAARSGRVETAHGAFATPAFMPVGTLATVKALTWEMVRRAGAEIVLANTYHLMLRPGAERIRRLGGLHRFMNWDGPILTDSGGFQVMSLAALREISDAGVRFRSHIDGSLHELTPERAMALQEMLDADIAMQLDECVRLPAPRAAVERAMVRSLRWAERCRTAFRPRPGYGLFGIVQGGTEAGLRRRSAEALVAMGFDGYAVGGLAVGEPQAAMFRTLEATVPHLPADRPRYLMGVGTPLDILGAVERGIDMFDCVLPTRSGRTGQAFTRFGPVNLRNARHRDDPRPLDETSDCPAAREHSRAYLHHLVRSGEILGCILLTWNNVWFYQKLMRDIRAAIAAGTLADFAARFRADWSRGDIPPWSGPRPLVPAADSGG